MVGKICWEESRALNPSMPWWYLPVSYSLNFTQAPLLDPTFMAGDREFGKLTEWDWHVPPNVPQQQNT
ncbi:sidestep protein [Corchorus olitorius]|uniref:Sidestep protein n=1 Tax=Corchorus olitorius TaxID=93759 RepID=A0A1R3KIW1_9ROSI|nr:sidestep protein [Corchorus olitorius]